MSSRRPKADEDGPDITPRGLYDIMPSECRSMLLGFVKTMENPAGGFNYPRDTPASIEETYFALNITDIFGEEYSSERTRSYVLNVPVDGNTALKHLCQMAAICDIIRLDEKDLQIEEAFTGARRRPRDISNLHYHLLLSERYGTVDPDRKAASALLRKTLARFPLPLSSCLRCIQVAKGLSLSIPRHGLIDWIQRSQNRDGGFGFYPGTTSFLENTWYAVQGLALLGSKPRDTQGCREFVLSCRTELGGFSRQTGAVPTLEYSFMAVSSLVILSGMMRHPEEPGDDVL